MQAGDKCVCHGLLDPTFQPLHSDGMSGATTAIKIWTDCREPGSCSSVPYYQSWKGRHSEKSKQLQVLADKPYYYKLCKDEKVIVDGVTYDTTIRVMPDAIKGECRKVARTEGSHPFMCDACDSL